MMSVFLIVKHAHGPSGHGEPGEPYLALATDGDGYSLGEPMPAFTTREAAEGHRRSFDEFNRYHVIELPITIVIRTGGRHGTSQQQQ